MLLGHLATLCYRGGRTKAKPDPTSAPKARANGHHYPRRYDWLVCAFIGILHASSTSRWNQGGSPGTNSPPTVGMSRYLPARRAVGLSKCQP
jgi:hypothetical protein